MTLVLMSDVHMTLNTAITIYFIVTVISHSKALDVVSPTFRTSQFKDQTDSEFVLHFSSLKKQDITAVKVNL